LLGAVYSEPYSATETEFALLKLLSATDSIPIFIDEYKPYDMPVYRRKALHRCIRRLYKGEVEERGRADQSLVSYRLAAPLCIAGETRPTEPALVERILASNPDKNELLRNPARAKALSHIKSLGPNIITRPLIRFLLGRDTAKDLARAKQWADRLLARRKVPNRVRDNITVMLLGLLHYKRFARYMRVNLPPFRARSAVNAVLEDLLEGGGVAVKTGLDRFLEELSVMAINDTIELGREYSYHEHLLAIHFPSCHAAYSRHCKEIGYDGEVPDRKSVDPENSNRW
jgi:hypothetical protein